MFINRLFAAVLHVLWPTSCPVCGRLGEVLCTDCAASLFLLSPLPRCLRCGGMFPCLRHPGAPRIRSASIYNGKIKSVILALKYGGFRTVGQRLGMAMAPLWERPDADLLLPVPLHRGSSRGYNQALEIARGLGRGWGMETLDAAQWARRVPRRAGLSQEERRALAHDAFVIPSRLRGLRVALVDDVCTTGTTLTRLAAACENAGVSVAGAYTAAGVVERLKNGVPCSDNIPSERSVPGGDRKF
ncbi:MAG: hypothetical protein K6E38_01030 [Fretibacterium sp.]|nr:hypothetical protein [Fretibacterium sp.]